MNLNTIKLSAMTTLSIAYAEASQWRGWSPQIENSPFRQSPEQEGRGGRRRNGRTVTEKKSLPFNTLI